MSGPFVLELIPHPDSPSRLVSGLQFEVGVRCEGTIELVYHLVGLPAQLRVPVAASACRSDGLWRHTCCEVFIAGPQPPAYREFNLSPSGQWQCYDFRDYRDGGPLPAALAPVIRCEAGAGEMRLTAAIPAADLPSGKRLRLGLCAVVEAADGSLSWWALRHPPGRPDFHHPDTFTLDLDLTVHGQVAVPTHASCVRP